MQAGSLRHFITLQKPTQVVDPMGGVVTTWTSQYKCYSDIDPPKGREFFVAGQAQSEVVTRIRIRYYSSVAPDWRIKFGTSAPFRIFDINSIIDPDERHVEQIMMCTESVV